MPTDVFARLMANKSSQAALSLVKTYAAAAASMIPADSDHVRTSGYAIPGDMGGALYKRVAVQPSHGGKFQSADGAWWEIAEQAINPKMFGAKFDGVTDDTAAINNAITALVAISGSFTPAASYMLVFPPGRAITQGGHVIPSGIKVRVVGAGADVTILFLKAGANTFIMDVQGRYSSVEQLSLNGNRDNNPAGLECLRINGPFCLVDRVLIAEAGGDGVVFGNAATAINSRMRNVDVRYCKGYGVAISGANASTDCQFTDVNVGTSGKSGFYLGSSSQKMTNCHSWGNGIESASDNSGFNIPTSSHILVGCQAESNTGRGFSIGTGVKHVAITGGSAWGNATSGIYAFSAGQCTITGVCLYNNGSANSGGSSSIYFANITLEGCQKFVVLGCNMNDDGASLPAGSYRTAPPFPFAGRNAGTFTVSRHYAEGTGCNHNIAANNVMFAAQTRSGVAIQNVGRENRYADNATGETTLPTLASAASIILPANYDLIQITGTTAITSISASCAQRQVTLQFASAGCVVTAGSNLLIGNSYTSIAGGTLSLICNGANWYRI